MIRRLLLVALVAGGVVAGLKAWPDVRRYLDIKRM